MPCAPHIRGILAMLTLALVILHAPMSQAGSDQPDDAGAAPAGRLVQPRGADGCIHRRPTNRCARGRALTSPEDLVVSPDGRHVYVAAYGSHAVAVFSRSRRTGCWNSSTGNAGACATGVAEAVPGHARSAARRPSRSARTAKTCTSRRPAATRSASLRATGAPGSLRQLSGPTGCFSRAARRRLHRRSRAQRADKRRGEP